MLQVTSGLDLVVLGTDDGEVVIIDAISSKRVSSLRVQSPVSALSVGELGVLSGHSNGKLYNHTKDKELTTADGTMTSVVQFRHSYVFSVANSGRVYYYA